MSVGIASRPQAISLRVWLRVIWMWVIWAWMWVRVMWMWMERPDEVHSREEEGVKSLPRRRRRLLYLRCRGPGAIRLLGGRGRVGVLVVVVLVVVVAVKVLVVVVMVVVIMVVVMVVVMVVPVEVVLGHAVRLT
ncbi:hypothetical protein BDP27DRAFT_1332704 [Rhodocollybia butyracea]|uniref:Transmembrane protein n=1 Tax=Rhodocollybia butyracea TaxID=206335 RepID=A0A9P5PGK8_9AGAR|nr:hypothetical protein BDP27DRAFT_1332704 [Rhodocollybia butyracea]